MCLDEDEEEGGLRYLIFKAPDLQVSVRNTSAEICHVWAHFSQDVGPQSSFQNLLPKQSSVTRQAKTLKINRREQTLAAIVI